ncbi:hypothetical protein [Paenibacillus sp. Leaf72]|uniref:hypothetical protein n=1 Tax=Paenibacillus sp. Leaf72 TaxID=1736234 RepID=UPI0006F36394|nr:hypothetical protein [Paenibacillus sp. Leaf72]KQN96195.1 hypothetical protein ASF12_25615 [Paenibacillus sp. Leaf72]
MLHSEFIIERKKALFSDKNSKNFPEKYHIPKNVLYSPEFFNNLNDDTHPTEFKLLSVVHDYLHLFPNTIASVIEKEELEFDIIDDLIRHLALITRVITLTNEQPVEESIANTYVKQLMEFIANKEENEELNLKLRDSNEETLIQSEDFSYLPREDQANKIITDLITKTSHLPQQALPLRAFIAIYKQVHNELTHSKGKRPAIHTYKICKINLTTERRLHNRYWDYFYNSLQMVSSSKKNLNLVLFEWEHNIVLASHINVSTKELPIKLKHWSRKVLSLAALLPTVEVRLSLVQYYAEHRTSILEESLWGAPRISVKDTDITDAMLKLASDLIATSLLVIPILEINTQRILSDEDKTLLEDLSVSRSPYLKLKDSEDIEETLLEIHHVQSLYRKHKLWDIQSIVNEFFTTNPDNDFTIDNRTIEVISTFVREKYFMDFLK